MSLKCFYLYLFFHLVQYLLKTIFFFKIKKIYNDDYLPFFFIDNDIQTEIKIGTPAQKIPLYIVFDEYLSVISNKSIGGKYDSVMSKTYNNLTSVDIFYFLKAGDYFYGKNSIENIKFDVKNNYIENNKISTRDFNYSFILCSNREEEKYKTNKKKNMIGLQYRIVNSERDENFLNQLKENNEIKTFTYLINFPESEIIFNVQNYEDFNYINYKLENFNIIIDFDEIKYNNETHSDKEVQINFDFNGIIEISC